MSYGKYNWSHWILSAGLGIVFFWIGVDILRHPDSWIGYIPTNLPIRIPATSLLKANGIFDMAIGLLLIIRLWPKLIAFFAAGHLVAIIATQGIDAVIIRDVGLLGASLALLFWPKRHYRHHAS
ncbi:MAG: hypothetical protein A3E36_02400 [Candidatus Andersenbacteria bacterium RIFCSPHIGHO2_12_FULL_45_11b]|uniref:DoxX family protein n=1 Tax=Candidatus Andersenbacteria bacterium RIFCSPHIGHO2_12_FULL_45_11b TaxID=1797282 RepID=A0A1G1X7T9_9BACT|nr:MAG: hypothetical protein A3E36_02400 [Candidatus Andersenbacteria bacterium RIFCSPHIGHO2_12_FULL_45_11b]